jgi:predicted metal-binding membrane protein
MKAPIFALTKNEQRVVIAVLMVLLIAAFARYWHATNSPMAREKPAPAQATMTPVPSPDLETDAEKSGDETN